MKKISLGFVILTSFLVIIFLAEPMAERVCAQSAKPLPPQFTAVLVHATYNVSATNQIDNSSIEFKIKNQPFTISSTVNAIYYLIQIRNPDGNWSPIYSTATYHIQSNGTYTTLNFPLSAPNLLPPNMRNATSVDFQLQAQTGYYSQKYIQGQMSDTPIKTSGYWEINFDPAEKSDWSNTQTVNLIQTSTTVPELPALTILPLLLSGFSVAVIVRHRKTSNLRK
jgi:hypothetical protein